MSLVSQLTKRVGLGISSLILAVSALAAPLSAASIAYATDHVSIENDVKVANVTAGDTSYSNSVNAKVDQVVKVQLWFHNRENPDSGKDAKNLRAKINIPTAEGQHQTITGSVQGDNTNKASDTATVNLSLDNAHLSYVAGSAKWRYNKGAYDGRKECQTGTKAVPTNDPNNCYDTVKISDKVVTNGTGVNLGDMRPCFAYESTVTVLARVKASEVKVNKYVSSYDADHNPSNNDWKLTNSAKPGDKLDYMIRFENKGNTVLNDVVVGDNLPDYMKIVPGTTYIINGNNPKGVAAGTDHVVSGGIDVGDYNPGAAGYVVFSVQIDPINKFAKCGVYTLKNVGVVRPSGMNEFYNTAWTNVRVECAPGETPKTPEQPQSPEKLPETGATSVLSALFGAGAIGFGLTSYLRSRRNLSDALNR
ncbi:MAG TPA: LPXTG cell wall anchor domain-containing protein [Candidatus Saccharimonadales bacterium]|nr:LPXTG cell wall anchor domain-containing protein [Candidatus Saccharimonadales bacterium]